MLNLILGSLPPDSSKTSNNLLTILYFFLFTTTMFCMVQKNTSCIAALLLPLYEDPDISDKVDVPPCEQCLKIITNHELYIRCTLIIPGNNAFIVKHGFLSRLKKNFEFKDSEDCYIVFFDSYKSINNMIAKYAQKRRYFQN